ncbi:MAG: galactose mutarotase [Steroidobacteraceae bacterium]|nr:galactose mutarotase [Steroidobacteraceae bacterium]
MRASDGHARPFQPIELGHPDGLRIAVIPYGARLVALWVPTTRGPVNVVLGYADPRRYAHDPAYHGAPIGRVSGRIARAGFELEGHTYRLEANEPPHHLHGGPLGFHARTWRIEQVERGPTPRLVLRLDLADGTDGYPGRLEATIVYTLETDALRVELSARIDRTGPVALTMHPYFNLGGSHAATVLDHLLSIAADEVLELDAALIPTGARLAVAATPFDFREEARIGERLARAHPQLQLGRGMDHTYLLQPVRERDARLRHEGTRLAMTVSSSEPALQVYAGHYLAPPPEAAPWRAHCGICLEPQGYPNAVNEPRFPSSLHRAGETVRNTIRYAFTERA